ASGRKRAMLRRSDSTASPPPPQSVQFAFEARGRPSEPVAVDTRDVVNVMRAKSREAIVLRSRAQLGVGAHAERVHGTLDGAVGVTNRGRRVSLRAGVENPRRANVGNLLIPRHHLAMTTRRAC